MKKVLILILRFINKVKRNFFKKNKIFWKKVSKKILLISKKIRIFFSTKSFQQNFLILAENLTGIIFLAISIFYFFTPFFCGQFSFQWDTREFGFPNLNFLINEISSGNFPLIDPFRFSGHFFSADIENAVFSPIIWIFAKIFGQINFSFLPFFVAAHFFWGSIWSFFLAKKITKNFFAAVISSFIFTFSGYAIGHLSHLGQVCAYFWIPAVLYFFILALEKKILFWSIFSGAVFSGLIFCGHANTIVHIAFLLFLLGSFLAILDFFKKGKKSFFITIFHCFLVAVFTFIFSAIFLLPVLEFSQISNRSSLTLQQSEQASMNFSELSQFFFPNENGLLEKDVLQNFQKTEIGITQSFLFVGWLPIFLVFIGIFSAKRLAKFFLIIGILGILVAMGKNMPVHQFLFQFFPGFSKIRMAAQILHFVFLSIAILAGIGFSEITKNFSRLASFIFGYFSLAIISINIFWVLQNHHFFAEQIAPQKVFADNAISRFLQQNLKTGEKISDEIGIAETPNFWMVKKIPQIWGNGGIKLKEYFQLFEKISRMNSRPISPNIYNFLGVKFVFSEFSPEENWILREIDGQKFWENPQILPAVFFVDNFLVESNENKRIEIIKQNFDFSQKVILHFFPKTFVKKTFLNVKDFFKQINFFSENPKNTKEAEKITEEKITILENWPEKFVAEISIKKPGFLVFSKVFHPGWRAKINEKFVEIIPANHAFFAIPVLSGKQNLQVFFAPGSFLLGKKISIMGIIIFLTVIISNYNFRKIK